MIFIFTCILSLLLSFPVAPAAQAFTCRNYNSHKICILNIKRSAKNYWEYRASVIIDSVKTPVELYDCHQRVPISYERVKHPTTIAFGKDDAGELICNFVMSHS
ncbi:hypothetical protein CK510_07160 [Brunnivagina elsteri CCALA 953]|uniref:Uncharacterized protein n=1 Tax=Brunnivagina elsteri CCALA 953 TaxID=987040 RepID=A0A2A2TLX6_9CYAN|nr:hypothetical protein CK510_07160 [Calothrix elsteri CCALA 953]